MTRLVALSGRKKSGKTTLSSILEVNGFNRISIADPMKSLLSKLYRDDIRLFYTEQGKEVILREPYRWGPNEAARLEQLAGLPMQCLSREKMTFYRRREAMQYVGTEVLRKYDPNFHVNRFVESFKAMPENKRVYIDDIRFREELNAVISIGAISLYIVRPYHLDCHPSSDHSSETSLLRRDFNPENVIINMWSLQSLRNRFVHRLEIEGVKGFRDKNRNCSFVRRSLIMGRCPRRDVIDNFFSKTSYLSAFWAGVLTITGEMVTDGHYRGYVKMETPHVELANGLRKQLKHKGHFRQEIRNKVIWYIVHIVDPFVFDDLKLWMIHIPFTERNVPNVIAKNQDLRMESEWVDGILCAAKTIAGAPGQIPVKIASYLSNRVPR